MGCFFFKEWRYNISSRLYSFIPLLLCLLYNFAFFHMSKSDLQSAITRPTGRLEFTPLRSHPFTRAFAFYYCQYHGRSSASLTLAKACVISRIASSFRPDVIKQKGYCHPAEIRTYLSLLNASFVLLSGSLVRIRFGFRSKKVKYSWSICNGWV